MQLLGPACPEAQAEELGGKARRLRELGRAGLPVPAWICVPARAFRQALAPVWPELQALRAGLDRASDAAAIAGFAVAAAALLADLRLPQSLAEALAPALARLNSAWLAVRSSAAGEDGSRHAFAGLFATWLQVPPAEVPARVLDCWRAAFGQPALAYLVLEELPLDALVMAVLIQVQIDAQRAGIYFQASPDGLLNEQVIVAGYGLGEGIVSGRVPSDCYRRDRFSGEWQEQIAEKPVRLGMGPSGPELQPVPPEAARVAVLTRPERLELIALCEGLEASGGGSQGAIRFQAFQDIEWCHDGQGWHLLQARPITALPPGPYHHFDSSNIQESYPGVVLPLTASLVQRGYGANFTTTLAKLGFSEAFLRAQAPVLSAMSAELEGRIYYRMDHWLQVLQWLPGARRLALSAFAAMISRSGYAAAPRDRRRDLALGLKLYPLLLARLLSLDLAMILYRHRFERAYRDYVTADFEQMTPAGLLAHFEAHFRRLLSLAYVPLLNDLWTGLLTALLRKRLQARAGEAGETLLHELLGDLPGLASAAPLQAVASLAEQVRRDPALQALVTTLAPAEAWERIAAEPAHQGFYRALLAYLQAYGGRSVQELKLEAPSYHEQPWRLLSLIRQQQAAPLPPGRSLGLRQGAAETLSRLWPVWHPQAWLVGLLLGLTRRALKRRESGRLDRTRLMAATRPLFRRLGEALHAAGRLDHPEDLFYLRLEELPGLLGADEMDWSAKVGAQVGAQVRARRAEYAAYRERAPRERLLLAAASPIPQLGAPPDTAQGLQGIGCAGAIAAGEALVLLEPESDLEVSGRILVTLSTDPGWVFLMSRAAGLVVERGNLLSHAAIMARELGLPTVVGVTGATRALKDGERIRIDGRTGKVERVEKMDGESECSVEPKN